MAAWQVFPADFTIYIVLFLTLGETICKIAIFIFFQELFAAYVDASSHEWR